MHLGDHPRASSQRPLASSRGRVEELSSEKPRLQAKRGGGGAFDPRRNMWSELTATATTYCYYYFDYCGFYYYYYHYYYYYYYLKTE